MFLLSHKGEKQYMPIEALLGSVMHAAAEDPDECMARCDEWTYWLGLINLSRTPGTSYTETVKGEFRVVTLNRINEVANLLASTHLDGSMSLGALINKAEMRIRRRFRIVTRERKMVHTVHGLSFTGTMDEELQDLETGEYGIGDTKSSGIWNKILDNGSVTTQNWTEPMITYHAQLRHYHWLQTKIDTLFHPTFYMILTPANLYPLEKSTKLKQAGQERGPLFFRAKAREDLIVDYERQLLGWLQLMANRVYLKSMPLSYGKIECPTCPFFSRCQGEATEHSEETGELLRNIYG